jgi:xylulokinase
VSDVVLGLDVGTSGLKAVLLDADGHQVDEATAGYELRTPRPGWTEQDPDHWWAASRAALGELWARGHRSADVVAVGLSGQMHSLVLLDAAGEVLAPSILWSDQRTAAECRVITERIGAAELLARTGNQALPGFTAPKLLWVERHWPDVYRRARTMLLPKDFLRQRLTGEAATDVSDASGTLLFDVRQRRWADEVVQALGIPTDLLPRAVEGTALTGAITSQAAAATGLQPGTPVMAGGSDNAAAAVGLGAVDPGVLTLSIGTSGVLFAPLERYPEQVDGRLHVFCHAVPDRWHLMAVTLSAGGSLRWLRDLLQPLVPAAGDAAYDWLMERASTAPPGADGLVFLPYLTGERTPYADPDARGVFFGLHLGHRLEHLARAVLEGVAFSQRQGLELMQRAGAATDLARGAGGGLHSPLWRQILADALGLGIQTTAAGTGAARGAAVLAGLGLGLYATPDVGITWPEQAIQQPHSPPPAALEHTWRTYAGLYPRLAGAFAEAASRPQAMLDEAVTQS